MRLVLVAGLLCAFAPLPLKAQPQPAPAAADQAVNPALRSRADDLLKLLRSPEGEAERILSPSFLAQVPASQFRTITSQITGAHGQPIGIESIEPRGAHAGTVRVTMERSVLIADLQVEAAAPHRISGLLITGTEPRGIETPEALVGSLQELPGAVSFAVARLDGTAPDLVAAHEPDRPLAIGSAFKLIILAELARQVKAGERRWSDVVALDRRSVPSGIMQDWPQGAPATLHTLATLMISRSDNTATDVLLHTLGREKVERMAQRIGMASAARNRPFLSTLELFALKLAEPQVQQAWTSGDEPARRRILAGPIGRVTAETIDPARFGSKPNHIDSMEWFASARDMVRVMDWLRTQSGDTAHAILAVNSGMGSSERNYGFVGYKGGSEPGVINMTYLVRNKAGQWHAVTGSWNNSEAAVDDNRFAALMRRAVALVR
jgi:hypothetical protein